MLKQMYVGFKKTNQFLRQLKMIIVNFRQKIKFSLKFFGSYIQVSAK